jgi:hypothetical protein
MNLKILRWLVANQTALTALVALAKQYSAANTLAANWAIVQKLAAIVIPLLESDGPSLLLATDDNQEAVSEASVVMASMDIDWELVFRVLLPLLVSILESLSPKDVKAE